MVCDREPGHTGAHRGYIDEHDAVMFWHDRPALVGEVTRIAAEILAAWDADRDSRVGKMLAALAGRLPGYRADIDALLNPGPSAGDLLLSAVHQWAEHGLSCEQETCAACAVAFNQLRLAYKVWTNSAHKTLKVKA